MAILYQTKCRARQRIRQAFAPFNEPTAVQGLLIGNDLDALLSAALLKELFGWDVVGIYDYRNLWLERHTADRLLANLEHNVYLAVDLDIYRNGIPSIGHHILQLTPADRLPRHANSLNPNLIFGISCRNFRWKYPLGTIHLLRWLFEIELDERGEMLCWLADSAYINAQTHRFRANVARWLYEFLDWAPYWNSFIRLNTAEYEDQLERSIGAPLQAVMGISQPGQVRSRHRALSGWQGQWHDPVRAAARIRGVLQLIQRICGWQTPQLPDTYCRIKGRRRRISVAELRRQYHALDRFLESPSIFSYVFPYAGQLNFTRFTSLETGNS